LYDMLLQAGSSLTSFSEEHIYSGVLVRVIIYSIFAFLISFAREIIKDIEDIDGDLSYGCRSLPIVYGVSPAKGIIVTSLGLILVLLCFWQVDLAAEDHAEIALYLAIAVQLPVIWLSIYVIRMHTKIQYHLAGLIAKIIMVTGILSMLWFIF